MNLIVLIRFLIGLEMVLDVMVYNQGGPVCDVKLVK